MLQQQLENYIKNNMKNHTLSVFPVEKAYIEKHQLVDDTIHFVDKEWDFELLERCDKETENVLATESNAFLHEKVVFLKKQPEQFIYGEAKALDTIRVDAIALEFDEIFGQYSALFGLRLQKKYGDSLRAALDESLSGEGIKYSIAFAGEEGLWEINLMLNAIEGFQEDMTFQDCYQLIYTVIFHILERIEDSLA